ncbi:hypothetical protein M0R88_00210 [Halorussus gelatinilyticus]|uniref:Uncharacterized protein n=1 Tax=Halorussus gelatinilyticus TaxID=2937524 RepID=A0A8U0IHR7_9EURY|nr:hypothetical protein [Halorussus gelatinilyticus]UPW00543.1 hypothetical protein M0R88_00210 [Halorussus gelatinilyticus]
MALVDVLAYDQPDGETAYRAVEAGRAAEVVAAHEDEYRKRRIILWGFAAIASAVAVGYTLLIAQRPLFGVVATVGAFALAKYRTTKMKRFVPSVAAEGVRRRDAAERYDV